MGNQESRIFHIVHSEAGAEVGIGMSRQYRLDRTYELKKILEELKGR